VEASVQARRRLAEPLKIIALGYRKAVGSEQVLLG